MSGLRDTWRGIARSVSMRSRTSKLMRPRTLAAALSLVFLATVIGGVPQDAQGYVPGTFPPDAGTSAKVVVDVSHTPTSPNPEPKPGDPFQYKATFTLSSMNEVGTTNEVVLTINADSNAPWTSVPVAADFVSTFGAPTLSNCTLIACTATYTNIKTDGVITFTHQATVKTPLPNGTPIIGSATGKINTKVISLKLDDISKTAFTGACSGPYTFEQKVGGAGAWLVDMKFADVAGQGKVILTPDGSTQIRAYNDPAAAGDTVMFTPPGGYTVNGVLQTPATFTQLVMANAVYRTTDPNSPFFIGADPGASTFANSDWLDSLNWSYDTSNWSGNTWLPAGTLITVKRDVTYLACLPGGITGDGTTNREFGIYTEIARANTTASGSDYDVFSTPGAQAPATCATSMFVVDDQQQAAPSGSVLYTWNPTTGQTTVSVGPLKNGTTTTDTHGIAAYTTWPNYVFYVDYVSLKLMYYDTVSKTTTPFPNLSAAAASGTLAFDAEGYLYNVSDFKVMYLTPAQVSALIANPATTATWNTGASLSYTGSQGSLWNVADIAIDGDGVMYLLSQGGSTRDFIKVTTTVARTPGAATATVIKTFNNSWYRGMAFIGSDLYIGESGGSQAGTYGGLANIYKINVTTGALTQVTSPAYTVKNVSDMGSCSFPKLVNPPPTGPAYKVQKSIINPDGSVAAAGTTGAPQTLNPDGTVTIDHVITVTAVGTTAGTFPNITDNASVPPGFAISGVTWTALPTGTPQSVGTPYTTFTIPGATLDPFGTTAPISRSYRVTMSAKAANLNTVSWSSAGTCNTSGAGNSSAGGFFNSVTMTGDADTTDNNDSCAQVFSGKLTLIKQIVDQNGLLLTSTDSQYFDLVAAGPSGLKGVSPTSNATGPTGFVIPGTYRLGEQGNDLSGAATSATYDLYATWSCVNVKTTPATVIPVTNGTITVGINQDVQCTIKNTKKPKIRIIKNATTPIAGNTHIGQTITPAADGTFTTSYTITVTNTSGFTTSTGPITDGFLVPAGLLWDGTKTATVTYNAGATGATATGLATSVTQSQLATWATLATSVTNLPNNGSVSFTITIPLKLDLTVPSGSTQTIYETKATQLSSCAALNSTTGGTYTSFASGIPNMTAIANEDMTYSTIASEDNTACVPVVAKLQWAVSKAAASTTAADGTVSAWAPAGTNGAAVQVASDGTVTVNYKVVVTNTGDITLKHPAITDALTLPTGFGITSVTVKQGATTVYTGTTASFTIPASTTTVAPGGTVEYVVQIKATVTSPSTVDWVKAGRCNTDGAGDSGFGGFFNFVSLTGDSDGSANNDACVPITPASATIKVYKLGANCDVNVATCPLPGANFALYAVDPTTAGATPIASGLTPDATNAVFTSTPLSYGVTYWLVETKAPTGFALLAQPVQFSVSTTGITLSDPTANTGVVTVKSGDSFALTVLDTPAADLPKAGGLGPLPNLVIGLLLVALGGLYFRKTFGKTAMGGGLR